MRRSLTPTRRHPKTALTPVAHEREKDAAYRRPFCYLPFCYLNEHGPERR
jgi:hypothetical protein